MRTVALIPIAALAFGLIRYPVAQFTLAGGLVAYTMLLLWRPRLWLALLPALLPILDLAPWSGRFFFDEFDFFVLATLVALYFRVTHSVLPRPWRRDEWIGTLMAVSVLISVCVGVLPLQVPDADAFGNYLSRYNALRVAKGFFWAWLLLPGLRGSMREDRELTVRLLVIGFCLGLCAVGLAVLWERGVIEELVHWRGIYSFGPALLDFTSPYRVTALFSQMHTGGTAIDGYLAAVLSFSLLPFFWKDRALRVLGFLSFALGTYVVLATFSRALYAAYGVILVFVAAAWCLRRRAHIVRNLGVMVTVGLGFLATSALAVLLFRSGGMIALAAGVGLVWLGIIGGFICRRQSVLVTPVVLAGLVSLGYAGMTYGIVGSKWTEVDPTYARTLAVLSALLVSIFAVGIGRNIVSRANFQGTGFALAVASVVWMIVIPAVGGYRMQDRLSTITSDVDTRFDHWADVLETMAPASSTKVFGMGLGSFPRHYFWHHASTAERKESLASHSYANDETGSFVEIGRGDFNLLQRVPIRPNQRYQLAISVRGHGTKAGVSVKFCHRNIIHSTRYVANCVRKVFMPSSEGVWESFVWTFDSKKLGNAGLLYWPVTLQLYNVSRHDNVIAVTDIRLQDTRGNQLIKNGDFSAGPDRWFFASDFEHLAWHPKNVLLYLFFEQGVFGLLAVLLALGVGVARQFRAMLQGSVLAIGLVTALVAMLAAGITGTLLDAPRIAMLWYMLLLLSVQLPTHPATKPSVGRARQVPGRGRRRGVTPI